VIHWQPPPAYHGVPGQSYVLTGFMNRAQATPARPDTTRSIVCIDKSTGAVVVDFTRMAYMQVIVFPSPGLIVDRLACSGDGTMSNHLADKPDIYVGLDP